MKNKYQLIDYTVYEIPAIEVYGDKFHFQDLYEFVGSAQFMTTFTLREQSESYDEYGGSVLGVIYYDNGTLNELKKADNTNQHIANDKLYIDSPCNQISDKTRGDLRYGGINVSDIKNISYLPYKRKTEQYESGKKKVPDIVEVEVDCSGIDVDMLNQNYLVRKHNAGTSLIEYEREQLIGITLAINQGRIDSRILNEFGFDESDIKSNLNIWMNLYKVKKRRCLLTDADRINYSEITGILELERIVKVINELKKAGISNLLGKIETSVLKGIIVAVNEFEPSILMHGKKQVFWDVDSYIHIALRHLKDYQVGNNKLKTYFSYNEGDLKSLIEKILAKLEGEIVEYLHSSSTGDFIRHGKMAVFYNNDHYHLRINMAGKLIQFHAVEANHV